MKKRSRCVSEVARWRYGLLRGISCTMVSAGKGGSMKLLSLGNGYGKP
jgi:hypothetical protein